MAKQDNTDLYKELMEFRCDAAIEVFRRKFILPMSTCEDLWLDLMSWFWLGDFHFKDVNAKPNTIFVSTQLIAIDELWHSFILCTEEYAKFCMRFFGRFIHHFPDTGLKKLVTEEAIRELTMYVTLHLGQEIAYRWFVILP